MECADIHLHRQTGKFRNSDKLHHEQEVGANGKGKAVNGERLVGDYPPPPPFGLVAPVSGGQLAGAVSEGAD